MKARAAELLRQDQAISQCKSFRGIADKLGVKRFQAHRRWFSALPPAHQMPADPSWVSDTPNPDLKAGASGCGGSAAIETLAASEPPHSPSSETLVPDASPSSETIADRVDYQRMTREEFMKASIKDCRALAREIYAEAQVNVDRYLATGKVDDLFPPVT